MTEIFAILQFPFMQRAVVAGLMLSILLATLGVFVVLRRMSFIADGMAHASLAGVAIGLLAGFAPLWAALLWGIGFAIAVFLLEQKTTLPSDAIIGVLFTTGLALGVVLISLQTGYQPDLMGFLFGNILAIGSDDVLLVFLLTVGILMFIAFRYRSLMLLSLNEEFAHLSGMNVPGYQLLFYILLAVSIVLGTKLVGVVLVSALLIFPVSGAKLASRSFGELFSLTITIAVMATLLGIFISVLLDLPTGPAIVLANGVLFLMMLFFGIFRERMYNSQ